MDDKVEWSRDDAKRIAAAVRRVERVPRRPQLPEERLAPTGGGARMAIVRVTSTTPTGNLYPAVLASYNGNTDTYSDQTPTINCWVRFTLGGLPDDGYHFPALYTSTRTADGRAVFLSEVGFCISETNGKPTDIPPRGCWKRTDPGTFIEWTYSKTVGDWLGYCPCIIPGSGSLSGSASGTVQTTCCVNLLPATLCATLSCLDGFTNCITGTFVLTYSAASSAWQCTLSGCSGTCHLSFACSSNGFQFGITGNSGGCWSWSGPMQCDPVYWYASSGEGGSYSTCGCPDAFTAIANHGLNIIVTECASSSGGGGGGGGGGIVTNCCPSNPVPQTLVARFTNGSGTLACYTGTAITLTYNANGGFGNNLPGWYSSAQTACNYALLLCTNSTWGMSVNDNTSALQSGNASSSACNPFSVSGTITVHGGGGTVSWTVTPT